mmetsp:Transcript_96223/g.215340  ORF Transcript_96223/g.215340 Transcript_96223/m.215340 type:complete len:439 (-) Transcript_96223:1271-2587(-)
MRILARAGMHAGAGSEPAREVAALGAPPPGLESGAPSGHKPRGVHEALHVLVAPVPIGEVLRIRGISAGPVEGELLLLLVAAAWPLVVVAAAARGGTASMLPANVVAPLCVVLLEAESLHHLFPGGLPRRVDAILSALGDMLQDHRGLLQHHGIPVPREAHHAGGQLRLLHHDIPDLVIEQQALECEEELHYDLVVLALLHEQLLQHAWQPGAGQVLGGLPLQREVADQHHALEHDVVLREAWHEEAHEEVHQAVLAELTPGHLRQAHVGECSEHLHQQVRGIHTTDCHPHELVHPLRHPHALALQQLVHLLPDARVRGDVPDHLAEERVPRLQHTKHDLRKKAAAQHGPRSTLVRGEIYDEGHEVLTDPCFREVDHKLQQHKHAVPVVAHQRLALVVHGKMIEEPEHDVAEGRVPEAVNQQLHDAGFDEGAAHGLIK